MLMSAVMEAITVILTQSVPTQLGTLLALVMQDIMGLASSVMVNIACFMTVGGKYRSLSYLLRVLIM